jgi:hypothetical protein
VLGISVIAYLDDFLWADKKEAVDQLVLFVRWLMNALGFSVSEKKSEWTPSQLLQFLGLLINTDSYMFEVPTDKLRKFLDLVRGVLQDEAGTQSDRACNRIRVWTRSVNAPGGVTRAHLHTLPLCSTK